PSPVRGTDQGAHRRPGRRRRRTRRQLQRRPRGCSLGTAAQRVELDRRERRADTGSERRLRSDRARMIPADQKRSNSVTESTFCQPYSRNDNFTVPCEENLSPLRSLQRSFLLVSNPLRGKSNSDTPLISHDLHSESQHAGSYRRFGSQLGPPPRRPHKWSNSCAAPVPQGPRHRHPRPSPLSGRCAKRSPLRPSAMRPNGSTTASTPSPSSTSPSISSPAATASSSPC